MAKDEKKKEPKLTKAEKKKIDEKQKAQELLEEFQEKTAKSPPKVAKGTGSSNADVEMYMTALRDIVKKYRRLNERLDAMKKDPKKALERLDLINERDALKTLWIAKKNSCKANISLMPEAVGILKNRELKDIQEEYRELDSEFKAMGIVAERTTLLDGANRDEATGRGFDPLRANNDTLLDKATAQQKETTSRLKDGLAVIEQTREQGKFTAAQLEEDREKIKRIDAGLDTVDSELEISKKLVTRFIKSIYTDKIIIACTFLVVVGIAGIIVYSALNPGQSTFTVPDAIKPPILTPSPAPSPSARLR